MYIPLRVRALRMISPLFIGEKCALQNAFISGNSCKTIHPRMFMREIRSYTSASELKKRINEELNYELESDVNKKDKEDALAFLKKNSWNVNDTEGEKFITFTKNQGNNKITIVLDVSSVGEEDLVDDYMNEDYEDEGQNNSMEGDENIDDSEHEPFEQIRVSAVVENLKTPEKTGVLVFDLKLDEDEFSIKQINFFADSKSALDSLYNPQNSNNTYTGPNYSTLDPEIQKLYEEYLAELNIDSGLAKCLYSYSICKEFNEYVRWLKKTEKFFST